LNGYYLCIPIFSLQLNYKTFTNYLLKSVNWKENLVVFSFGNHVIIYAIRSVNVFRCILFKIFFIGSFLFYYFTSFMIIMNKAKTSLYFSIYSLVYIIIRNLFYWKRWKLGWLYFLHCLYFSWRTADLFLLKKVQSKRPLSHLRIVDNGGSVYGIHALYTLLFQIFPPIRWISFFTYLF